MLFRLSKIHKSYSGNVVLSDVSFQANPNERIGLVGRNGAGKTTVFRIITQEETEDSGEISRINNLKIGLLEQHVEFAETETVHTAALSAFQRLHDIEAEMRRLEVEMETQSSDEILERYAELQIEFENEGGFEYTARAEAILLGIGFRKEDWELQTDKLSGGQKNRLGMARLLLSDSDILLLDEPTNHLDVKAVEWLEDYLSEYDKAFVIISHDRYFLDRTCSKIVELENGRAYTYKGNYTNFVKESTLQKEQRQREYENQQAYISKTEAFIRKNLAGQKTKQAKSRRNMLQRMDKLEAPKSEIRSGKFDLRKVERAGVNVLSIEELSIGYPDTRLAENIDLVLHRGECLGVIGGNGTGKTTFLRTVLGDLRELSGEINWGAKVNIGYYSQQLEDLDLQNDLLTEMRKVAPKAESGDLRSFLAGFLFFGDDVFKRVGDLSGGEKGRVSLAKLIYSNVNVLILDEPTNHLDIPSREALEAALCEYEGTIITVSHDRYFLDQVATQILSFEQGRKVETFNGNYSEFHDWKEKQEDQLYIVDVENVADPSTENSVSESNPNSLSKNEIQKIQNRIDGIEESIPRLEKELKQLADKINQPDIGSDHKKSIDLSQTYGKLEKQLQDHYSEWEILLEKIS